MPIVCLGLSHHSAPVGVRERHAFPPSRMGEALVALRDYPAVLEAAMLQTCGRLEIYAELEDYELGVAELKAFLANFRHGSVDYDLESYMYTLLGRQAVEHLFRVSTGLDSMLIGEAEILGQVKDAYVQAHEAGSLGKTLHRLFHEAISAGKAARSRTRIGEESASVATAAIELAKQRLGTLANKSVLVIGAGKMGRLAAKRLRAEGATRLIVANRTKSHAQDVVNSIGFGDAVELPTLEESLAAADIVITSTGAAEFVLTRDIVSVGRLDDGLTLYRFRYLWSRELYVGVMAQEVAAVMPQAVTRGSDGYLRVDYARLGLKLETSIDRTQYGVRWNAPNQSGGDYPANDVKLLAARALVRQAV